MIRHLEALRKTMPDAQHADFWRAVDKFSDLDGRVYAHLTLLKWASYFPPDEEDTTSVAARVFCVMSGLVPNDDR